MSKKFDELFREIVAILRRDYAGAELTASRFDPRYYNTSVGQAWHDRKLDELLFFRYVNQMLACTGDRRLRLTMRFPEGGGPWSPGFLTRRCGDALYVVRAAGDGRLRPGDCITAVNGGSPAAHRAAIQKNFFYADEPEREDWNGFLKMASFVDVRHADGGVERLDLGRFPLIDPIAGCAVRELPDRLILDLRNAAVLPEDELLSLLPLLCAQDTPLSRLIDTDLVVNYSRLNCLVKAAGLRGVEGAEPFLAELEEKSGRGMTAESVDDGSVIPGRAEKPAIVLTDTWTRDGAETLALAAKRAGALLLGRPTHGTIDLCGDVTLALDDRYSLTWPTAVTAEALAGRGVLGRGVAPDAYIPWTPEECSRDVLMDAAESYRF